MLAVHVLVVRQSRLVLTLSGISFCIISGESRGVPFLRVGTVSTVPHEQGKHKDEDVAPRRQG